MHFLKVPFKQAEPISFSKPLKDAIEQTFDEDSQSYQDDIQTLETLRLSCQDPQVHDASAVTHLSYYAQLSYLESKFDISEEGVKLFFSWGNAFGNQTTVSSHNLGFEKASVLFNLAAIYSHLGAVSGTGSEDAIKLSAVYFQQSAGAFQTIINKLPSWNILGTANTQLDALTNLLLAQAQEVFLVKAVASKMKEGTLAKLAMQVSTFYKIAYEIAKDSDVFDKSWLSLMYAKSFHFASVAQYYKSIDAEQNAKYGEQVGWLFSAVASGKLALEKTIVKNLSLPGLEVELRTFSAMVEQAYQSANKDNDKIYMESVPKSTDLSPLPPARMVNPILVPEVANIVVNNPVFRALVPFKIHQAASKYANRKDLLIKQLSTKLNEATSLAHTTLASQRLPGSVEALEQPIGLPAIVLERSQEVKSKGGARYIDNAWSTLVSLSTEDWNYLQEAIGALDQEEREDAELKRLYGPRWNRTLSSTLTRKLREKGDEYKEKIISANNSNALIRTKIDTNLFLIEHLSADRRELEASIPASTVSSTLALKDPTLKLLKTQLDALSKNIKQRPSILANLLQTGKKDDIGMRLTMFATKEYDESAIFDEQIKVYENDANLIKTSIADQESLLDAIYTSNKAFMDSSQTNTLIRERESALSNLDVAYKHFKDISGNLEEGIKFFSELEQVVQRFRNHCDDFVKARQLDRDQLLAQIQTNSNPPPPQNNNSSSLPKPVAFPGVWNSNTQHNQQQQQHHFNHQSQQVQSQPAVWNPQQQQSQAPYPGQYQAPGGYNQ